MIRYKSDFWLPIVLITIFVVFGTVLVFPLDSGFETQLFIPYELIFLIAIGTIFFIIYRYLSNSLTDKKEELINLIKSKYSETIAKYERRIQARKQDTLFWNEYSRLMKNIYSKTPGSWDIYSHELKMDLNMFDLLYTHRLKSISLEIEQQIEKFRLRDLEKINKYPRIIETIYKQRTGQSGLTFPPDFEGYNYGGMK